MVSWVWRASEGVYLALSLCQPLLPSVRLHKKKFFLYEGVFKERVTFKTLE